MLSTVRSGSASSLLFNGVFEGLYGDSLSCSFDVFFLEVISVILSSVLALSADSLTASSVSLTFSKTFSRGCLALISLSASSTVRSSAISTVSTVNCDWFFDVWFLGHAATVFSTAFSGFSSTSTATCGISD